MLVDPQILKRREVFLRTPIDGQALKRLVEAGLAWLRTNQQSVNALNVFPVPDGDTGTNMVLTMQAAYDEVANSPERNIGKMAHAVAHGALMGARGNSGVILSQIWRGIARSLDKYQELDVPGMARALATGRETAYKGVVRPVEGTILTVIKDSAAAAEAYQHQAKDLVDLLEHVVQVADVSVINTPNLLPILKDAGVVDAGGKGLFYILEGMLRYVNGQSLESAIATVAPLSSMNLENTLDTIEPGQDYEVVVDFRPEGELNLAGFYDQLEQMGTSIQVGEGDGIYRMHIHVPTEKRYDPIEYCLSLGTVTKVAIENLIAQMESMNKECNDEKAELAAIEPGQIAVVAVAPGPGIARVFASLGVAAIIEGGQTMNPSTKEILHAFENLPTDHVIILPNNKNIILAARNATELTVKKVAVVPSRSVPEGLAAMLKATPNGNYDRVVEDMNKALNDVQTVEITNANRSVEIDEVGVTEGQVIGLLNGKLVSSGDDLEQVCLDVLAKASAADYELITLFWGSNIDRREVNHIADAIRLSFPGQEIEVQEGCQPHYQFIMAVE